MLNHGYPSNVDLSFDPDGGCQVILTQDVAPGSPLYLSYGQPTNPSRFLATYGFLNDEAPAAYCKLVFPNPSQELVDVGYDPSKLLFYTADGGVSQEVWDVLLYNRLEWRHELEEYRQAFYQAHVTGDEETKHAIHMEFFKETCGSLRMHVDDMLMTVSALSEKMKGDDAATKHPRLPLLKKHNAMVSETFEKVKAGLDQMQTS